MITAHLEVDKKARWLYAEKQRDLGLSSGQWYVSLHFPPSVWFYWFCSGESWFNGPWPTCPTTKVFRQCVFSIRSFTWPTAAQSKKKVFERVPRKYKSSGKTTET